MGNRALIIGKGSNVGIYLHGNGGRDSVEAFLQWAELSKLPSLENRGEIALAATLTSIEPWSSAKSNLDSQPLQRYSMPAPFDP